MALSENGRGVGLDARSVDFEAVQAFLKHAHAGEIYDAGKENHQIPLEAVPHVDDLDKYVSLEVERELEAEIKARFPVPVEIRPFRRIASLFPTILG